MTARLHARGKVRDIYVEDGKIVAAPADGRVAQEYDVKGRVVMAGAIDMHTHIGGGKLNIARAMLPEVRDSAGPVQITRYNMFPAAAVSAGGIALATAVVTTWNAA